MIKARGLIIKAESSCTVILLVFGV